MKFISKQINEHLSFSNPGLMIILTFCLFLFSCSQKSSSPEQSLSVDLENKPQTKAEIKTAIYQKGVSALANLDYALAEDIFAAFIVDYPEQAGAYINLALIRFNQEKYNQSLQLVNKAIELNNQIPQCYNLQAQLWIMEGKIMPARDAYLQAIKLKPDYANAQYNLALLYDIYLQDINLAIQHYETYMSLLQQPDENTGEWIKHLKSSLQNG
jgi:tetratricopeptide (TPR) repeat protein